MPVLQALRSGKPNPSPGCRPPRQPSRIHRPPTRLFRSKPRRTHSGKRTRKEPCQGCCRTTPARPPCRHKHRADPQRTSPPFQALWHRPRNTAETPYPIPLQARAPSNRSFWPKSFPWPDTRIPTQSDSAHCPPPTGTDGSAGHTSLPKAWWPQVSFPRNSSDKTIPRPDRWPRRAWPHGRSPKACNREPPQLLSACFLPDSSTCLTSLRRRHLQNKSASARKQPQAPMTNPPARQALQTV